MVAWVATLVTSICDEQRYEISQDVRSDAEKLLYAAILDGNPLLKEENFDKAIAEEIAEQIREMLASDEMKDALKKIESTKQTFAAKVAKEAPKMSWADICEVESDEDKEILSSLSALDIRPTSDDKDELAGNKVLLPAKMGSTMPRWHKILRLACKFCKLEIVESKTTLDGVVLQNLYSENDDEVRAAYRTCSTNSKDIATAYNSIAAIMSFFTRPYDLEKSQEVNLGKAWVLYKISSAWTKDALGPHFDLATFRQGSAHGDPRLVLTMRLRSLISRGDQDACAEMIMSALDKIVYAYVRKIYAKKDGEKSSLYMKRILELNSKSASQYVSLHARKIVTKDLVEKGSGKSKKVTEREKTSYHRPWVNKSDLWTQEELIVQENLNNAFRRLDEVVAPEAGSQYDARKARVAMATSWAIADRMSSFIRQRRKLIRMNLISARASDRKADKITDNEWASAANAVLSSERTSADRNDFIRSYFPAKANPNTEDWLNLITNQTEIGLIRYAHEQIHWDLFDSSAADPQAYHLHVVRVNEDNFNRTDS